MEPAIEPSIGARVELERVLRDFGCGVVAIGNGVASAEAEQLVRDALASAPDVAAACGYMIVDEVGASVY